MSISQEGLPEGVEAVAPISRHSKCNGCVWYVSITCCTQPAGHPSCIPCARPDGNECIFIKSEKEATA